jgi:polynucleotide 5'-kinase involved in rRNA processing
MKQIPESIKQQAIALRQQGKTYAEISKELQVSLDWCKRNLKSVQQKSRQDFNELYTKSKSIAAVSRSEIYHKLDIGTKEDKLQNKLMTSAVRRIRANNKQNIVRPDWMIPQLARFCTNSVVQIGMEVEERCNEEAFDLYLSLKSALPESQHNTIPSVRKIKAAMVGIAMAACSTQPHGTAKITSWLDSLYNAVNALEARNGKFELTTTSKSTMPDFEDIGQYIH